MVPLENVLETGNHPESGGLAAPRGPDQNHELTGVNIETDILYCCKGRDARERPHKF